jgi:hypothetical protein
MDTVPEITELVDDRARLTLEIVSTIEEVFNFNPKHEDVEDTTIAPGYSEFAFNDPYLDMMLTTLVPTLNRNSSPILILTFLGKDPVVRPLSRGVSEDY